MKKKDPKTETAKRIARTEAYAEQVRRQFAGCVNAILDLNKKMPALDEGVMFSFDGQSLKMQKQVEQLMRQLHSVVTMAIKNGIKLEWDTANKESDRLVSSVFGKKALESPQFSAWVQRNQKAQNTFINRSENGLNLSDRVWNSVHQLRDEMEVAMTVAIGEGDSAQSMSRKVRKYLNDPDLMFRRFRYKDESGEWQRKWKKRIKDPVTGKYRFIDYDRDSYKTGAGVYKSSAKNAMRVARTETNIAYRRADNERWSQMDFVIGQRVQLSHNHPRKDICDKLAGDYPKDFVLDGWHPQCFCYVTPITIPPEETAHLTKMMLNGEDWRKELQRITRGRQITQYPQNFKDWVTEHADQIADARSRGTEPYFIKNNKTVIDGILNGDDIEPVKPQHSAEVSPEPSNNTEQQKEDTSRKKVSELWQAVNSGKLPNGVADTLKVLEDDISLGEYDNVLARMKPLLTAVKRHESRTQAQIDSIIKRWQARVDTLAENSTLKDTVHELDSLKVQYKFVERHQQQPNDEEIISRVGGGDRTSGSCASLAFAFVANKAGLNVLDFRGGDSWKYFSSRLNLYNICEKIGGYTSLDITGLQLLKQTQIGKTYYAAWQRHAAIVRQVSKGKFEYLELQSATSNGWKPLDGKTMSWRFGGRGRDVGILIDIEMLQNNAGFRKMMGYINTDEDKQRKGASGNIK